VTSTFRIFSETNRLPGPQCAPAFREPSYSGSARASKGRPVKTWFSVLGVRCPSPLRHTMKQKGQFSPSLVCAPRVAFRKSTTPPPMGGDVGKLGLNEPVHLRHLLKARILTEKSPLSPCVPMLRQSVRCGQPPPCAVAFGPQVTLVRSCTQVQRFRS
jgi:hypothetical protein